MTVKTIEAKINAISNAYSLLSEISLLDSNKEDIKAHEWLYKYLLKMEIKYKNKLKKVDLWQNKK